MKGLQLFEIAAILGAPGQALEADDAAKTGKASWLSAYLGIDGIGRNGFVVQWRQTTPHEVDDPVPAADAEVMGTGNVGIGELFVVSEASCSDTIEKEKDRRIYLWTVGHQKIGILGRTQEAVGNDAEPTYHYIWETDRVCVGDDSV